MAVNLVVMECSVDSLYPCDYLGCDIALYSVVFLKEEV